MKMKNITILLILLSISLLLISGCDDRDIPTSTKADYRVTRLESSVDKIYADNNVTFAYISAYVKDQNNFGAINIPVRFQADRGSIISLVNTNNSGIAKVPFYDSGESGLATITAYVYTYSQFDETSVAAEDSKQIQVMIEAKPPIGNLTIEISSTEFFVNQSVVVRARVFDIDLNPVADSTMVRFETDRGHFVGDDGETNMGSIAIIPTQNGNAPLRLNVGQQAGIGEVKVRIDTLVSMRNFSVKPGNPFNLQLNTYLGDDDLNVVEETNETTIDNEYKIVIEANLKDAFNNPNASRVIRFETNLGSFYNTSETYTQNTDVDGVAKVVFTPGLSAGPATIKAFANSDTLSSEALFTIKSDELHSIRFNNQEQVNLNVANTGGIDSSILYVSLYDINGNLVDRATDIYFKIINNNIPGEDQDFPAYLSGQSESGVVHTTSSGGQAAVSVVTGAGSGVLQIRVANDSLALTSSTVAGAIRATKSNILIHAGPPASIVWGDLGFDQGESVGGGLWELLLAAHVRDIYNNPVEYGTSVFFDLIDVDGWTITIQGNAFTGNGPQVTADDASASTVDSLSSIGVAYTLLTYGGSETYKRAQVQARCIDAYGDEIIEPFIENPDAPISEQIQGIELPWNQPDSDIQAFPGNLAFYDGPPPALGDPNDFLFALITIRTRDGQGYPTPNVYWTFTADRGEFYDLDSTFANQVKWAISGDDGYARIYLKLYRYMSPPTPDGFSPGQQQVQIFGRVLGTGILQQTNVTILRYPYNDPE
ncbi:hypothetical protein JEZ13_01225 [bacterium]|nr:hypothetical protein [bacterium]